MVRDSFAVKIPGEEKVIRCPYCVMCQTISESSRLQAHHIRPRSIYPQLACQLENGIMLCLSCHQGTVHRGNSFKDMESWHHWRWFVPAFDRYVGLAQQRRFNRKNQGRIR